MMDDPDLLHRYSETRDEDAFAELVRRHLSFVYNTALRRVNGDSHRADEIAQSVFADLARKARPLSRHPSLIGWLHTSTRFAAADFARRERRRQTRELAAHAMSTDTASPSNEPDWTQLRSVIDDTLDRLGSRDREAILLRFFENQSFSVIGAHLNLAEDTARKRVDRALDKLRLLLAQRGVTSTAAALGLALSAQTAIAAPASLAASITTAALSSTAKAAGIASIFHFLTATKLKTSLLGAAIVAGLAMTGSTTLGVIVTRQHAEIVRRELAFETLTAERHRLALLRQQLAAAQHTRDELRRQLAEARARLASPKTVRKGRSYSEEYSLVEAAKRNSPEYAAIMHRQNRLWVQSRFGDLFDRLHLPSEQLEQLKELLADDFNQTRDAIYVAHQNGTVDDRLAHNQRLAATEDKIRTQFGDAVLDAYREHYLITFRSRPATDDIALDMADAGQPLKPDQQSVLTRLVYEEIDRKPSTAKPPAVDDATPIVDGLSPAEQATLTRAASQLSDAQLNILRTYFVETRKFEIIYQKTMGPDRFFSN
ncbi:MAG: sigma-70 family RNA polymerase sigma factor [Opitutaceae bacterium]|jgi:RNA polymerase sigma factor (sigma-70 family)